MEKSPPPPTVRPCLASLGVLFWHLQHCTTFLRLLCEHKSSDELWRWNRGIGKRDTQWRVLTWYRIISYVRRKLMSVWGYPGNRVLSKCSSETVVWFLQLFMIWLTWDTEIENHASPSPTIFASFDLAKLPRIHIFHSEHFLSVRFHVLTVFNITIGLEKLLKCEPF